MGKFKDKLTKKFFDGEYVKGIPSNINRKAVFKLTMVEAATDIRDLANLPSNRLEKLEGKRKEQWSVRVNDQYRICFKWQNGRACEIEFTDYH